MAPLVGLNQVWLWVYHAFNLPKKQTKVNRIKLSKKCFHICLTYVILCIMRQREPPQTEEKMIAFRNASTGGENGGPANCRSRTVRISAESYARICRAMGDTGKSRSEVLDDMIEYVECMKQKLQYEKVSGFCSRCGSRMLRKKGAYNG